MTSDDDLPHQVLRNFQTEGGSLTSVAKDFHKSAYIFHYTYGIEYTLKGKPQGVNQIGEWSLDKRHYGSDYPPKNLEPPPEGANALAYWLLDAWNEASANIESWPLSKSMGTIGWRRERITPVQLKASTTALPSMQVLITAPCLPLPTGARQMRVIRSSRRRTATRRGASTPTAAATRSRSRSFSRRTRR